MKVCTPVHGGICYNDIMRNCRIQNMRLRQSCKWLPFCMEFER
nr:MAG TPA: Protein of unknown function (DUF2685) [Caudoviricetes sp.]